MRLDRMEAVNILDLLKTIRISVDLSRFPIHQLSRKGRREINIKETTELGTIALKWEVSYNEQYGPARQLAYRLDTWIINRRIDELRNSIPKYIRIGSLSQISRELGITDNGSNLKDIKQAILQNVGTVITAKLTYKNKEGGTETLEAAFNRYSAFFTGQTLPNGQVSDGVYLTLSDAYQSVIQKSKVRPIDYTYLKTLRPAAQRFYEIMSRNFYVSIKHQHKQAHIPYSEYCKLSAQTRHLYFKKFLEQMRQVHKPHLKSHYIKSVLFKPADPSNGQPDWIMVYVPGNKAIKEYNGFNNRPERRLAPIEQKPDPAAKRIEELIQFGFGSSVAKHITEQYPDDEIIRQLEAYRFRSKPNNPQGYLLKALQQRWEVPDVYKESRVGQYTGEVSDTPTLEDLAYEQRRKAFYKTLIGEAEKYVDGLPPEALAKTRKYLLTEHKHKDSYKFFGLKGTLDAEVRRYRVNEKLIELAGGEQNLHDRLLYT